MVLLLLSVAVGAKNIPLATVLAALAENTGQGDAYVVWDLRVPLADPGILGVNAGAAVFVAVAIALLGVTSVQGYVWFAFAGALVVTPAVYAIGSGGRGGIDAVQLTLAGVALGALLQGIVMGLTLLDPGAFDAMRSWNAGSSVGRGWDVLLPVLPFLGIGLVAAALAAPSLNAVALGDDLARSLGAHVTRTRVLVILAVLLAGGATAIAGPIAFVGLMVPHVARWIVGPDQRWIIACTVLLAPSLMLAADVLGRVLLGPGEIPVGVVTPLVGGPVLILLVRRLKASGL
ncbi:iron chelate uptake ABC transporter family permease subunit [Janibacter alkaliphilus]